MTPDELKPCPFCGNEPEFKDDKEDFMREISCTYCDITMSASAVDDLIPCWNARAYESAKPNVDGELVSFVAKDGKVFLPYGGKLPDGQYHIIAARIKSTLPQTKPANVDEAEVTEILRIALCYAANADTNLQNRNYTLTSEDLYNQIKPYLQGGE